MRLFINLAVWQRHMGRPYDKAIWQSRLAEPCGRATCQRHMAYDMAKPPEPYGKALWQSHMARQNDKAIWQSHVAEPFGRDMWQSHMSETYGRAIWQSHKLFRKKIILKNDMLKIHNYVIGKKLYEDPKLGHHPWRFAAFLSA